MKNSFCRRDFPLRTDVMVGAPSFFSKDVDSSNTLKSFRREEDPSVFPSYVFFSFFVCFLSSPSGRTPLSLIRHF